MATIQQQPNMKAKTLTLREKDGGSEMALDLFCLESDDDDPSLTVSTIEFELLLGISWLLAGFPGIAGVLLSNAEFLENKGQNHVGRSGKLEGPFRIFCVKCSTLLSYCNFL